MKNYALSIVERLVSPISGSSRNITADNWFTSISLVKKLLPNYKLTCVGTIRKNKRELPKEFTETKQRPITSSIFGYKENMTTYTLL